MNDALKYYGIDWAAMACILLGLYVLGNRHRGGFLLMMLGNVFWIGLAFMVSSLGMLVANGIFFCMNTRGFVKWGRSTEPPLDPADSS